MFGFPLPGAVLVVSVLSLLSVGYCHYEVNPLRSFRHERAIVKLGESSLQNFFATHNV